MAVSESFAAVCWRNLSVLDCLLQSITIFLNLEFWPNPRTRRGCRAGRLHRLWITQRENSGQCLSIPSLQLPSVSPSVTETMPRAHSSSSSSSSSRQGGFPLCVGRLCDSTPGSDDVSAFEQSLTDDNSDIPALRSPNLKFGLFNAQSAVRKALDLSDLITEKSLDFLVVTESWLHESGDDAVIRDMTPAGYKFCHCPRATGQRGGGIALIYRSGIIVRLCDSSSFQSFESMNFVISCGKHSVRTVALYRPPPSPANKLTEAMFFEDFGRLLSSLPNKNLLILGDFNFHCDDPGNRGTRLLMQILDSADLSQHVSEPTHRDGHTLDLVVSRSDKAVFVQSVTVENLLMSDHFLVMFETDMERPVAPKKKILARNIRQMDVESFRNDLADSELVRQPPIDVEELSTLYNQTLSSLLNTHAPETEKLIRDRPESFWFSESVLRAKTARRRAEKRWRRRALEVDRLLYQRARNRLSQAIRHAKSVQVQSLLEEAEGDARKMFSVVDGLLGKESSSPVLPELDSKQAADALSTFFVEKIETIRNGFSESNSPPVVDSPFAGTALSDFLPVTEDQLRQIIAKSRPTSCVSDPIPTKLLLDCLDILLPVLVQLMNGCLLSGIVPRSFKAAVIKPLLKKNGLDPNESKNFRPVSNLPYISKLLERVVSQQFVQHLNTHAILDKFQSAYRPGHSCETALLRVLNDVLCSSDCGNVTLLVLLDLSAAFDVIDHDLLLDRLHTEAGIAGTALSWFRSYLSDRTQSVIVQDASSCERILTCGVPQGSVLGPVLFSIYTSQLGRIIDRHGVCRKLFADDTELYRSFRPDPVSEAIAVQAVEACCLEVKAWMASNKLKLNDDKTEAILCGSETNLKKVTLESVTVGNAEIPLSDTVRDLGLILDRSLTMVPHINKVVKTCFFHLRALGQLRPHLNKKTANAVAVSLIQSRLDFCNSCLWGLPQNQLQRLQKVQNTAARIVTRSKKTDHITPVLRNLHWLPVPKRIDHKMLSLAYGCVNDTAPSYLKELIPMHVPSRGLRSSSQSRLRVPSIEGHKKKSFGARSFECAAPQLWNGLPLVLREANSRESFKRQLKTFLFN